MFELDKKSFEIVHEAVKQIPFNMLMARSVIQGHVDGRIFVDSCENPKTFYIVHSYCMTYLCGYSENTEFNNSLINYFEGKLFSRTKDEWLQAYSREWDDFFLQLIEKGLVSRHDRVNFKFAAENFYEKYKQVEKTRYEITSVPVDKLFDIPGSVVPKVCWTSPEQYAKMAEAFTIIIDGKLASTAFCSALHDNKFEIGIETLEEFQGKGFAYLVCAKMIEYCLANGLEPIWSCRLGNTGSLNLAKKLGFVEILRMPYYHIPL